MERIIEDVLDNAGLIVGLTGYRYFKKAVSLRKENEKITMEQIYEIIGKEENKNPHAVERQIRTVWQTSQKDIAEYFNVEYRLTTRKVLALLTREVEKRCEDGR